MHLLMGTKLRHSMQLLVQLYRFLKRDIIKAVQASTLAAAVARATSPRAEPARSGVAGTMVQARPLVTVLSRLSLLFGISGFLGILHRGGRERDTRNA